MCLTFSALLRPKSKHICESISKGTDSQTVLWNCASKVICSLGNFAAFCSRCEAVAKKGTTIVLKVVVCSRLTGFILGLHHKPVMRKNTSQGMSYGHIDQSTLEIIIWAVHPDDPREAAMVENGHVTCIYIYIIYIFHVAFSIRQQPNST